MNRLACHLDLTTVSLGNNKKRGTFGLGGSLVNRSACRLRSCYRFTWEQPKTNVKRGRKPDPRAACSSRLLRNDFHSQGTHQLASQSVLPEVENQNPRYTTRSHPHERLPGRGSQIQGSRVRTAPLKRLSWPRDSSIGKPIGSPRGRKSDPRYTVRSHPHERLPVPRKRKLKFNFRSQAGTGRPVRETGRPVCSSRHFYPSARNRSTG